MVGPDSPTNAPRYIGAALAPGFVSSFLHNRCLGFFYFLLFYFRLGASFWLVQHERFSTRSYLESHSTSIIIYHRSLGVFVDQSYPVKILTLSSAFSKPNLRASIPINMYNAARSAAKPRLSLNTSHAQNASRPSFALKSPSAIPRTPISPVSAASPTSKRFSTLQVPTYAYTNTCSSKSILKIGRAHV